MQKIVLNNRKAKGRWQCMVHSAYLVTVYFCILFFSVILYFWIFVYFMKMTRHFAPYILPVPILWINHSLLGNDVNSTNMKGVMKRKHQQDKPDTSHKLKDQKIRALQICKYVESTNVQNCAIHKDLLFVHFRGEIGRIRNMWRVQIYRNVPCHCQCQLPPVSRLCRQSQP